MPEIQAKYRSHYALLAAVLTTIYVVYFALEYAPLTLVVDREAKAMEKLIKYRLRRFSVAGFQPIENILDSPNRSMGCSFFLMESLYRNCKAVTVARVIAEIPSRTQEHALLQEVTPLLQRPCDFLIEVPAGDISELSSTLQCGSGRLVRYKVSVFYLMNGKLNYVGKITGRLE